MRIEELGSGGSESRILYSLIIHTNGLVLWYTENRKGVRTTIRSGYKTVCRMLDNDQFGQRKIDSITARQAKEWLAKLQSEKGFSYNSIHTIRGVVRDAFKAVVFNGWVASNPFNEFSLKDVIENDSSRRDAMDEETEKKLMNFIAEDKHFSAYYDAFFILLHTGMRISEFCGLTFDDVDLEKQEVRIDHQLMRGWNQCLLRTEYEDHGRNTNDSDLR